MFDKFTFTVYTIKKQKLLMTKINMNIYHKVYLYHTD